MGEAGALSPAWPSPSLARGSDPAIPATAVPAVSCAILTARAMAMAGSIPGSSSGTAMTERAVRRARTSPLRPYPDANGVKPGHDDERMLGHNENRWNERVPAPARLDVRPLPPRHGRPPTFRQRDEPDCHAWLRSCIIPRRWRSYHGCVSAAGSIQTCRCVPEPAAPRSGALGLVYFRSKRHMLVLNEIAGEV